MARRSTPFAALTIAVLVAACGGSTPSDPASPRASAETSEEPGAPASGDASAGAGFTVSIGDRTFGVTEITVPVGDVTYVNESDLDHTVTEGRNGGEAENPRVNVVVLIGETKDVTFPEPGDYQITCLFHEEMNMVVHVE